MRPYAPLLPGRSLICHCRSDFLNISLRATSRFRRRCSRQQRSTPANGNRCCAWRMGKPGGSSRPCIPKCAPEFQLNSLRRLLSQHPNNCALEPANENVDEAIESAELIDDLVQRMSALKQAVEQAPTGPSAPPASGLVQQAPSLHVVVQRIESRRRNRSRKIGGLAAISSAPSTLFRWECGAGGEIAWVDGVPRGALVGRSLARKQAGDGGEVDHEVVRAFALRAPFRDAALTVAGDGWSRALGDQRGAGL